MNNSASNYYYTNFSILIRVKKYIRKTKFLALNFEGYN